MTQPLAPWVPNPADLEDGQMLQWNAATGRFEAVEPPEGSVNGQAATSSGNIEINTTPVLVFAFLGQGEAGQQLLIDVNSWVQELFEVNQNVNAVVTVVATGGDSQAFPVKLMGSGNTIDYSLKYLFTLQETEAFSIQIHYVTSSNIAQVLGSVSTASYILLPPL